MFSQVLPSVAADSTPVCYFGDFKAGSKIGEVRGGMTFAQSDQRYFELDSVSFRVTTRNAINVLFGVGTYGSDASANRGVPGPIVALKTIT
jgi:HK97 family phage major capsid protein